ncbi:transmembrane protein 119 [Dicentrarchus labrax]|uniref:transmembrane protein 119 n=1 Tax=Dicentrarchus labrax TaxID=13489 RepID=UPI0021F671E1|nr:transmembrane protein 119 [Dicentrarchus labrax]
MKSRLASLVTCVTLLSLWCSVCHATPLFYNISMDGSGDEAELELLFPTSFSTRAPAHITAAPGAPTLTNTITTTMIRLKDFVLTRVVDFLQENLLIIIVVTSLLIVMVFIICCASAMSHKRKLEAYKPPPNPPRKYVADKTGGSKNSSELQERPYAVDHVKRVQTQSMASPKNLRMPSKALVGERGRDVRSSPRQEVRKVRAAEEVEKRREEPKQKEQAKHREEVQQSPSTSSSSSQPVCTCHLKKAHH